MQLALQTEQWKAPDKYALKMSSVFALHFAVYGTAGTIHQVHHIMWPVSSLM